MSGTVVVVLQLPHCDLCGKCEARFDAATRYGPWAYLCPSCFAAYGIGLGTGVGQYLVTRDESGAGTQHIAAALEATLQEIGKSAGHSLDFRVNNANN